MIITLILLGIVLTVIGYKFRLSSLFLGGVSISILGFLWFFASKILLIGLVILAILAFFAIKSSKKTDKK